MPDITTTQIFSDGEKGITATKMNNIIANSVIQPDFVTAKPSSSTLDPTDQLLEVKGAGTYARITGQQLIDSVSASVTQNITPTIWSVRLRSFNAIGNPTSEVDQRNSGNSVFIAAGNQFPFIEDRWQANKNMATATFWTGQNIQSTPVKIPGTNFIISRAAFPIQSSTVQASVAAGEYCIAMQTIEGPMLRELIGDVTSISLLVSCDISPFHFAVSLRTASGTAYSIVYLCTYNAPAGTYQLITIPNIPVWTPSATWNLSPGNSGYVLSICVAAGSTYIAPSTGTWVSGTYLGATGIDNLAAQTGKNFFVAFVQHEPGAQCSTLMDCPFTQNLDACLRYFCKSYDYDVKPGTASTNSNSTFFWPYNISGAFTAYGGRSFSKPMAKVPTMVAYNNSTGAANSAIEYYTPTTYGVGVTSGNTSVTGMLASKNGVQSISSSGTSPGPITLFAEWTADTGW
jgi:hypothetical protein